MGKNIHFRQYAEKNGGREVLWSDPSRLFLCFYVKCGDDWTVGTYAPKRLPYRRQLLGFLTVKQNS